METEKKIEEIFTRGVGQFIDPDGAFRKKLLLKAKGKYNKDIIIKYGVDPTRPDIHLGHAVCFRKLRQLQVLGCKVVFLVGDFTASIGDPTGKNKVRPELEQKKIEQNMRTFLNQINKLLRVSENLADSDYFSWIRNSDWYTPANSFNVETTNEKMLIPVSIEGEEGTKNAEFDKNSYLVKAYVWEKTRMQNFYLHRKDSLDFALNNLLYTLKHITYSQLIERDMFQNRIKKNEPLFMHELLYPVFQGVDSMLVSKVYGSCDLEVGGTDQEFNMLMGRKIMSESKHDPQAVLSLRLLEGVDGKEKMSKSLDNYIGITEEPNSIFGKVMSIPDTSIANYFELATEVPMDEIKLIKSSIKNNSINPRDAKVRLAKEIVALYHGADEATKAEEYFVNTFSKGEIPENIAETKVEAGMKLVDLIVSLGFAGSKGDARRKIEQGGVELGGEKTTDPNFSFVAAHSDKVLKVGKKDFVRIVF